MADNEPTKLDKLKQLVDKRKRKHKEMLDDRYQDMSEYEESDQERDKRIMDTDEAWTNI